MTKINSNDVIAIYKSLLGRPPESNDVIQTHLSRHSDIESLLKTTLDSKEFRNKNSNYRTYLENQIHRKPSDIQTDADDASLDRLFDRIHEEWTKLGDENPYFSVITDKKYLSKDINDKLIKEFFELGSGTASLVDAYCRRANLDVPNGTCLELGCGVGRVTHHLAKKFDHVVGVDISYGNLQICSEFLQKSSIDNVDLIQISDINLFEKLPEFDFLFSFIVLQHNSPPVQKYILSNLLNKVKPGGLALFQTPSYLEGYAFSIKDYLKSNYRGMEMHCLPMPVVFRLLNQNEFDILEVLPDNAMGKPGSFTYFARKRGVLPS